MKQRLKKILKQVFFIPILFISLVSCSDQGSNISSDGEMVIEFFNQKPEISNQLEDLAEIYNEQNDNVRVTITTIGSGEGAAGLQAKFTSGNPPAVMMLGGLQKLKGIVILY